MDKTASREPLDAKIPLACIKTTQDCSRTSDVIDMLFHALDPFE
jgi:hypothetical protein